MGDFDDLYSPYAQVAARVDQEFARAAERYRDHIAPNGLPGLQCRKGCTSCCSQLFNISLVEAAVISRHVRTLPRETQERLRERALAYQPQCKELLGRRAAEAGLVQIEGKLPIAGLR